MDNVKEKMESENEGCEVCIIGSGGIGSHLITNLVRALQRGSAWDSLGAITIRIYDSDRVTLENTAHQSFEARDVGLFKVDALARKLEEFTHQRLRVVPCNWDLIGGDDVARADLAVVAVDSSGARKIVHSTTEKWLDLRCKGDGFVALDYRSKESEVEELTPEQTPTSCQHEGALQTGNIQFGHLLAAAHGSQWVLQSMRQLAGEPEALIPMPQISNISGGTLARIGISENCLEPGEEVMPEMGDSEEVSLSIDNGNHDSACIKQTIAWLSMEEEWGELWGLADRLGREVSILIDAEGSYFVDIGERGEVRAAPPIGATIPFSRWIHTHPEEAYWSPTDLGTLSAYSGILQEAIVIGRDYWINSINMPPEESGNMDLVIGNWSNEERQFHL